MNFWELVQIAIAITLVHGVLVFASLLLRDSMPSGAQGGAHGGCCQTEGHQGDMCIIITIITIIIVIIMIIILVLTTVIGI
jgi:hypothetical protein